MKTGLPCWPLRCPVLPRILPSFLLTRTGHLRYGITLNIWSDFSSPVSPAPLVFSIPSPTSHRPAMTVHTCNPRTLKVFPRRLEVQWLAFLLDSGLGALSKSIKAVLALFKDHTPITTSSMHCMCTETLHQQILLWSWHRSSTQRPCFSDWHCIRKSAGLRKTHQDGKVLNTQVYTSQHRKISPKDASWQIRKLRVNHESVF